MPLRFSDALNWLEALVSSVSLVCAIEESIARISDLVMAVKKFAYDERSPRKELDVHDSLQSTLTILGHKLRIKQITSKNDSKPTPSIIQTTRVGSEPGVDEPDRQRSRCFAGTGTDRDFHVDGAGQMTERCRLAGGEHRRPRVGNSRPTCCPASSRRSSRPSRKDPEPGLDLEIVHRIVTQKFGGKIDVESKPATRVSLCVFRSAPHQRLRV